MRHPTATMPSTTLVDADIDRLRAQLRGEVILPGDTAYEAARPLWNGMVDKRPAVIARCTDAADVAEAIRYARRAGLVIAVRGGGHSIAGVSSCDGGLVIDLSAMQRVTVDLVRRTAHAEPGVLIGTFDAATQAHGLATTMGVNADTGIAGLTLGGGLGRLGRKHGLACDNLLSAELVLADGRKIRASVEENADLFWGVRGGGGNFGVATSLEYRLHPLGPTVLGGMLVWDWTRAGEAMRHYAAFCAAAPDEVDALGILLTSPDGAPVFAVSACFAGPVEAGERALRPLRQGGPLPAQDAVAPMAYTALQSSADPIFPRGRRYYWKSHFLQELRSAAIDRMLEAFERVSSPMSVVGLQQAGGAIARVPADVTAYGNRDAAFDCIPISIWEDPALDAANIAWSRDFWEAIRPFATGGVYVNNLGDEGEERIRAAYGKNYARLAALKAKYDPDNVFQLNQNIRPAT